MSKQGNCAACGIERQSLHRDHIVPKYKGGIDDESNIQYLCANCHEDKTKIDLTGRKLSDKMPDEWRQHLSDAHKGRSHGPMPQCVKDKIAQGNKGKVVSKEARKNISEARLGVVFSDETRRRMSEAASRRPRRPQSPETRAKISSSLVGRRFEEGTA